MEEVDWEVALERAAAGLKDAGRARLAALDAGRAVPRRQARRPADFRLRHSDFSADGKRAGIPWLGMKIAELGNLDRVLVVGSFLRKDHPLIAQRLRQAAKRGAQIHVLHSVDDDWLMPVASKTIVAPSAIPARHRRVQGQARRRQERRSAARQLRAAAPAGGADPRRRAGARREARLPRRGGELGRRLRRRAASAAAVCRQRRQKKALLLLNVEPELDCADPLAAEERRGSSSI